MACHLGVLADIPTIGIGKNVSTFNNDVNESILYDNYIFYEFRTYLSLYSGCGFLSVLEFRFFIFLETSGMYYKPVYVGCQF